MWCVPRCGNNNHFKHLRDRIETMSTPTDPSIDITLYKMFLTTNLDSLTISEYLLIIEILSMRRGLSKDKPEGIFHIKHICASLENIDEDTCFLALKIVYLIACMLSHTTDMTSIGIIRRTLQTMEDKSDCLGICSIIHEKDNMGESFKHISFIYCLLRNRLPLAEREDGLPRFRDEGMDNYMMNAINGTIVTLP